MTPTWMMISHRYALAESGAWRSMSDPKFQMTMLDTKYEKTRFSRLPGFRMTEIPASERFSRSARRGRSLWSVTGLPLGPVEGEDDLFFLPLLVDLVPEDAEDQHVPVLAALEPRLAQ